VLEEDDERRRKLSLYLVVWCILIFRMSRKPEREIRRRENKIII
jgi:hypothetical protein